MMRGQRVQESLGTKSFEVAKRLVENIEKDILLGVEWKKERELFETAWPEFLQDKAQGNKTKKARPKTLKEYVGFGERFYKDHFDAMRLTDINEDEWRDFVEKLKIEKPGMQFDNVRKYLMGFLSWALRKGKIATKPELYDPDAGDKESREVAGPGKAYTLEELKRMRDVAQTLSPKFNLFILMAQYMGMRPGEITQLKKDRIDLKAYLIRLRRSDTKDSRAREVPIHKLVHPHLVEQMKVTEGSPCLFPNQRNNQDPMDVSGFKKQWAKARGLGEESAVDIEGRVYDFRHTFITNALRQGMNAVVVAKMTGTSLKMIEERYLHLEAQDMTKELEKFELGPK